MRISKNGLSTYKTSTDHIFIEFKRKIVHLAVLHKYKTFYLVERNEISLTQDIQLSYGDKLRAIDP